MSHTHAVAWIDHHEAHIVFFNLYDAESSTVKPADAHRHLHHKSGATGSGHDKPDETYLHGVATALAAAQEILIVGPASAKTELMKHMQQHDAALAAKVKGVETVDHPSEGELVKFARNFFAAADRRDGVAVGPRN